MPLRVVWTVRKINVCFLIRTDERRRREEEELPIPCSKYIQPQEGRPLHTVAPSCLTTYPHSRLMIRLVHLCHQLITYMLEHFAKSLQNNIDLFFPGGWRFKTMSTISLWASFERDQQERYTKSLEEKQENIAAIDALESLMRGKFSASQTARRIANIYEPRIASKQRSSVGILWGNIAEATRCVGVAQCLSDLMGEMLNLPDAVDTGGYVVKQDGATVWRGLPSWGWIYFEHGIGNSSSSLLLRSSVLMRKKTLIFLTVQTTRQLTRRQ